MWKKYAEATSARAATAEDVNGILPRQTYYLYMEMNKKKCWMFHSNAIRRTEWWSDVLDWDVHL